jgi:hypothetical protein
MLEYGRNTVRNAIRIKGENEERTPLPYSHTLFKIWPLSGSNYKRHESEEDDFLPLDAEQGKVGEQISEPTGSSLSDSQRN